MRSWAGRRRHGAHPDAQGGCRPAGPGRVGAGGERPPGVPGRGSIPPPRNPPPPPSCRLLLQLNGGFNRSPAGVRRCAATPGAVRSRLGGGCWGFFSAGLLSNLPECAERSTRCFATRAEDSSGILAAVYSVPPVNADAVPVGVQNERCVVSALQVAAVYPVFQTW